MKTFLYDITNFGLIHIMDAREHKDRTNWEVSIFKSCILDIGTSMLSPKSPLYEGLNNKALETNFFMLNKDFMSGVHEKVLRGTGTETNEIFEHKKAKAKLIAPLISLLTDALTKRSLNKLVHNGFPLDDTLAFEVYNSNPDANQYSPGIVEFAKTLEITPAQAYAEIQLEFQSAHSIKMRAYALTKKYQQLIRNVATADDANMLLEDMKQKLFKETYI